MEQYFISFQYRHYCQGYDWEWATVLVRQASSFENACEQVSDRYLKARYFKDMTI